MSSESCPIISGYENKAKAPLQQKLDRFEFQTEAAALIIVAFSLLVLFSSVTGALKLPQELAVLSPELKSELKTQDQGLASGNWHSLLLKYRRLLRDGSAPARVHFLLGRLYSKIGLYLSASNELAQCLELTPRNVNALLCAAQAQIALGDFEAARIKLDKAIALSPSRVEILVARSDLALAKGFPERALRIISKVAMRERNSRIQLKKALCYYKLGQLAKAHRKLAEVLIRQPRSSAAREMLALIYTRQGRFEEAYEEYSKVNHRGPLGMRCKRAQKILERVLRGSLDPGSAVAYFQSLSLARKQEQQRYELLDEAARREDFPEALLELAILDLPKRRERARSLLEKAVDMPYPCARAHFRLGLILHDMGEDSAALAHMEKAVKMEPSQPEMRLRLAVLLSNFGEYDRALQHLRRAINLSPTDPRPYAKAGAILLERKQRSMARNYLREAMLLNPFDYDSRKLLEELES